MEKLEFKGTKGNWFLDGIGEDSYMVASDINERGNVICVIPDDDLDESRVNWTQNAKLIASAPNLLEALQNLLAFCEFHGYTHSTEIYKAKQAIEKALK